MAIEISALDVANAEEFIAEFLAESVPNGRFSKGTALRDLVVKAFAYIFAHLQKENAQVRALQNLTDVQNLAISDPDKERSVSDAVDALLSNWFITRKSGGFARGTIEIRVSRKQDYLIPATTRFTYSRNLAFFPDVADVSTSIVIPSSSVYPVIGSDGQITDWYFSQRVVAARTGTSYNVEPQEWVNAGNFSPYILGISSSEKFGGGREKETSSELVSRSGSAIAVRNLINPRSIDAVLREKFSQLRRLLVVGFGDAEMQRDLKLEFTSGLSLHVGGCYDVFLELPVTSTTFTGQIGTDFDRPDKVSCIFRDPTIPDWTLTALQVGDVISVTAGLDESPKDFTIREILPGELRISVNNPFSLATDILGTSVDYFIYRPLFGVDAQILPIVGVNVTGETSYCTQTVGRILLPGGPHYDITDIAVINPNPGDPFVNAADGYVHFPLRVNTTPAVVLDPDLLQYQVLNSEQSTAQSMVAMDELLVDPAYDGKILKITYDTLVGFSTIDAFLQDRFERILCASSLARAFFPAYLSLEVEYTPSPLATSLVDAEALTTGIIDFINTFSPLDILDTSDIVTFMRNFSPNVGTVYPFSINYSVILADGRVAHYVTDDLVNLDSAKLVTADTGMLNNPLSLSLSDRTVRYLSRAGLVSVVER